MWVGIIARKCLKKVEPKNKQHLDKLRLEGRVGESTQGTNVDRGTWEQVGHISLWGKDSCKTASNYLSPSLLQFNLIPHITWNIFIYIYFWQFIFIVFFHYHLSLHTLYQLPPPLSPQWRHCCPCPWVLFVFCSIPPPSPLPSEISACSLSMSLSLFCFLNVIYLTLKFLWKAGIFIC